MSQIKCENVIPIKSKLRYETQYERFCQWKLNHKATKSSENVLLAYISERSKTVNSASLWAEFSMLKSMLKITENIDAGHYKKVLTYLKQNSKGYKAKKSKTLNDEECKEFLCRAPDESYLMMKIALIMGIYGACRQGELVRMEVQDIKINEDSLVVSIPDTKSYSPRSFTISNEEVDNVNLIKLFKNYLALRPARTPHNRLFIYYKKGKCSITPVGKNTLGAVPSKIAAYLNLDNPKLYNGHCFRRSSATLFANTGANLMTPKRCGGRKSSILPDGKITLVQTETTTITAEGHVHLPSTSTGGIVINNCPQGIINIHYHT